VALRLRADTESPASSVAGDEEDRGVAPAWAVRSALPAEASLRARRAAHALPLPKQVGAGTAVGGSVQLVDPELLPALMNVVQGPRRELIEATRMCVGTRAHRWVQEQGGRKENGRVGRGGVTRRAGSGCSATSSMLPLFGGLCGSWPVSSNVRIPTSSLRKKDGRDRHRERYPDLTRSCLRGSRFKGRQGMEALTQMRCVACRKDAPTVTDAELAEFHRQVSDWDIVELDGIKRLRRVFSVDDFAQALGFTKKVGELAEEEGHHPALLTEWGRTTVTWWTHKIKGLHRNDFIMAAKTDALYQPGAGR
jgi:4a-hydroxytetrahydrobiopterin dehydratase